MVQSNTWDSEVTVEQEIEASRFTQKEQHFPQPTPSTPDSKFHSSRLHDSRRGLRNVQRKSMRDLGL